MTIANKFARRLCALLAACGLMGGTAQAQTVIYYHTDALGSPMATTNAAGVVIERTEYEPYGQVLTPPVKDGPGYTGHVSDAQTGLSYMQQRYYDPQIGRFLSLDPVTADANTGGNFNRYWYANNNPYRFRDPDGRYVCTATGKGDCDRLEKAANLIHKAAEKAKSDSRVAQVSKFLGKPGEKNGVEISGELSNSKNLGEAKTEGGKTYIGLNFGALSGTDRLGSVTMHEGSHGVDQTDPNIADQILIVRSRSALNTSELKAGTAQARMFELLGRNEPYGLYSTATGVDWDAINDQADRSIGQSCRNKYDCNP